jgi:hypothetical protein
MARKSIKDKRKYKALKAEALQLAARRGSRQASGG